MKSGVWKWIADAIAYLGLALFILASLLSVAALFFGEFARYQDDVVTVLVRAFGVFFVGAVLRLLIQIEENTRR